MRFSCAKYWVTWESARSEIVAVRASYEADPDHFGVVNTKTLVSKVPGPIQDFHEGSNAGACGPQLYK